MCVQCLWSQFSCQNRNVNRKWPPWIGIECVVHTFPQHQWSYLAGLCECGQWQLSDVPASCDCSSWNSRGKDLYSYTFNGCVEPLLAQGFGEKELVHLFHQEMLLRSRLEVWIKVGKKEVKGQGWFQVWCPAPDIREWNPPLCSVLLLLWVCRTALVEFRESCLFPFILLPTFLVMFFTFFVARPGQVNKECISTVLLVAGKSFCL